MTLEVEFDFSCPDLAWADLLEKSFEAIKQRKKLRHADQRVESEDEDD